MNESISETEIGEHLYAVRIGSADLEIDVSEVRRLCGFDDATIPEHFESLIQQALQELPRRCEIQAGYRVASFSYHKDSPQNFMVGDTVFCADRIVTGKLRNATQAAFFICTLGPGMEDWIAELNATHDLAFGFIVNTVASSAVESATNVLHDFIGEKMSSDNLKITNRYSPGYCNWSVEEQHKLFRFFPKEFCGVTLTDSALMTPIKSVSGIIGIGSDVRYREYTCDHCGLTDCTYRVIKMAQPKHA